MTHPPNEHTTLENAQRRQKRRRKIKQKKRRRLRRRHLSRDGYQNKVIWSKRISSKPLLKFASVGLTFFWVTLDK